MRLSYAFGKELNRVDRFNEMRVETKDARWAGTDSLVTATIVRDGVELLVRGVDHVGEDDLERGTIRNFDYYNLPLVNDETELLPEGVGTNVPPHPSFGFEFSNGLSGHLMLRLRISSDDMWIKDKIELYVRDIRWIPAALNWQEDSSWSYIAYWGQDIEMSTDPDEGYAVLNLILT